jgi:peptidyl-dipeptidase Dcp
MTMHLNQLSSIASNAEKPTFENTLAEFDRVGAELEKVGMVFSNLTSSLNTEPLQVVQTEMSPILAAHSNKTYTVPGLFARIDEVFEARNSLGLSNEQIRLTERIHLDFTRAGAKFTAEQSKAYGALMEQLAGLETQFQQNVMADESSFTIVLKESDLSGCPADLIESAKQAAVDFKKGADDYVITLSRSLVEPFITFSDRRDLREKAWQAWTKRGELDPSRDNQKIAQEILKLRKQQAEMHGCPNFAIYQTADMMAKTPEAVMELLEKVWARAKESANRERKALEEYMRATEGLKETDAVDIQPWDWRYYAEKVRQSKYDFDEATLKPYLSLTNVTNAVMTVSNKLFGLRYIKREDIESYHPDVDTYEVRETLADGTDKLTAIFIHDNFARQFKSSGAWMSEYRGQTKNLAAGDAEINMVPVISNNNNFAKGAPTLLSFDDATTLFHEMGHGHHGMLSDATYSRLAGTNVLTDFVELPSQLMEHWLKEPEVLYTIHYTLYTVRYTLYTIHYTLYTIHCTLHTTHYTLYTVHCAYLEGAGGTQGIQDMHYARYTHYALTIHCTHCI